MARVRDNKPFFNEEWFLFDAGGGLPSGLTPAETMDVGSPIATGVTPESVRMPVTSDCQNRPCHTFPHRSLDEIAWSRICAPADGPGSAADRTEVVV